MTLAFDTLETILPRHGAAWRLRFVLLLLVCAAAALAPTARAAELPPGGYFWYMPEHEKYGQTEFFTEPDFGSANFKVTRAQRFRYVSGQRGWAQLSFDDGTQAYIHLRILRSLQYDPAASDPWYEFERASVFSEPPAEIEARLKPPAPDVQRAESRVPVWKRYKESWGINRGGIKPDAIEEGDAARGPAGLPEKKPRGKYPSAPPLAPEAPAEAAP